MAVPVHGNKPDEVRTAERLDVDPEHARPILELAFPKEHKAVGRVGWMRRLMLVGGAVLMLVAAFAAGYVVRGSDSSSVDGSATVEQTTPRSPDAIDRAVVVEPTTPVSPDAIDRPEVVEPTTPRSPDAIDR